jgi:hypothetical protein
MREIKTVSVVRRENKCNERCKRVEIEIGNIIKIDERNGWMVNKVIRCVAKEK